MNLLLIRLLREKQQKQPGLPLPGVKPSPGGQVNATWLFDYFPEFSSAPKERWVLSSWLVYSM